MINQGQKPVNEVALPAISNVLHHATSVLHSVTYASTSERLHTQFTPINECHLATPPLTNIAKGVRGNSCLVRAWRASSVLSILAPAPSLSSPREAPQVDCIGPQTFPAKHVA